MMKGNAQPDDRVSHGLAVDKGRHIAARSAAVGGVLGGAELAWGVVPHDAAVERPRLGMASVNAGVLFFEGGRMGTLFLDPLQSETDALMNILRDDYAISAATSGEKALELALRQPRPDLILLDVERRALRGDQVLELTKLFDFLQRSPIVLHSSKPEEELKELVGRSGASGYIKKTSNSIHFINQVEEWLKSTRE